MQYFDTQNYVDFLYPNFNAFSSNIKSIFSQYINMTLKL